MQTRFIFNSRTKNCTKEEFEKAIKENKVEDYLIKLM